MVGPKLDQPHSGPQQGAQSSDLDDAPLFRLHIRPYAVPTRSARSRLDPGHQICVQNRSLYGGTSSKSFSALFRARLVFIALRAGRVGCPGGAEKPLRPPATNGRRRRAQWPAAAAGAGP